VLRGHTGTAVVAGVCRLSSSVTLPLPVPGRVGGTAADTARRASAVTCR